MLQLHYACSYTKRIQRGQKITQATMITFMTGANHYYFFEHLKENLSRVGFTQQKQFPAY